MACASRRRPPLQQDVQVQQLLHMKIQHADCGVEGTLVGPRMAHAVQPAMHARSVYSRSFVGGWALLRARARATRLRIGIACMRRAALAASVNAVV